MRHVVLSSLLFTVLVLACLARAADSPEHLNRLEVAVVDNHGEPVTGLTMDDFQVLDDGKPKPIQFFRFTGGKTIQTALAPREYSNRSTPVRPLIVILFDMLNGRVLEDAVIKSEIIDALKNLEESDNIFLYLLTPAGELIAVHPLPLPDSQLKVDPEPWTRQIAPMLDQAAKPYIGFHPVDDRDIKVRYDQTLKALGALGGRMTEVTGRKNLVWVTHGFPILGYSLSVRSQIDFTNPLQDFYQRLALSQILLYPVDQSRRGAGAAPDTYSMQTLDQAADLTGGRRLTSDRVGEGITTALNDSRGNYEIAYAFPDAKPDPKKRRKLRVTVNRKDARVLSPQAYYMIPPVPPQDLERHAIENAIHSPYDATDIGVRVSVAPGADPKSVNLTILVDPADLPLQKSGDNRTGHFDMVIAGYGANGFQQASKIISFDINLTPEQFAAVSRDGLVNKQAMGVGDSLQSLRVVVYNPNLNATGSVRVPVKP